MLDRKGIFSYLAITFTLTYLIEGALIASGFSMQGLPPAYSQLVIAGVMWIPALATVITIRFVTHEGFAITNLRFGLWRPYVAAALLMPVIFAVIYGLTWLLGLGAPDWQLTEFRQLVTDAGGDISSARRQWPHPARRATRFHRRRTHDQRCLRLRRGVRLARLSAAQADAAGQGARV